MDRSIIVLGLLFVLFTSGCAKTDDSSESIKSSSVTTEVQASTDAEDHQEQSLDSPVVTESIKDPATESATTIEKPVVLTSTVVDENQAGQTVKTPSASDSDAVVQLAIPDTATSEDRLKQRSDIANCTEAFGGLPTNTTPPVAGSWTLEFQDDFLGNQVDGSKWKIGHHWEGINGVAANQPDNISQNCGYLTIAAEKRDANFSGKDYEYTTGELSTFKRFRQRYGYFEARIRYDAVQGLWPSFWLMPDRGLYGDTNRNRATYLKFDLNSENRSSVVSAILELYVEAASDGTQNLVLQRVVDDNWSENNITWKNRPISDPLWMEQHFDQKWSAGDKLRLDVTKEVNRALAGDKVLSLSLADTFMRGARVSFASKESIYANRHPRLVLAGANEPMIVNEDASVSEGTDVADNNFGSEPLLHVEERWKRTASTADGGMEFDIMESLGHWGNHKTSHSLHWDGYGAAHKANGSGIVDISPTDNGFHTYGLNWQPGHAEFYVDGNKTYEWTNDRVGSVAGYIIMGLQMGGWADQLGDNRTADDSSLPGEMVIDYVRVWSDTSI